VIVYLFAAAMGIGLVAGSRSMLAPAAVAWAVHLNWMAVHESPLAFIESKGILWALSLAAVGELIADLLPRIPRRTALVPLAARVISGGFCGACVFLSADRSPIAGASVGAAGAIIGAFAGYEIRRRLVAKLKIKDLFVALGEDLVAIGLALLIIVSR